MSYIIHLCSVIGYIPKVVRLPVVATTDTWGFFEWVESSRTPKLWNAVAFDCMIARTPAELDSRHLLKINHFFAFRLRVLTLYLFLNGPFPASFSPFQYSWQWTNKHPILKFANDWIRPANLWRRKRPLYQLSHNHRLDLLFVNSTFDSFLTEKLSNRPSGHTAQCFIWAANEWVCKFES